MSILSLEACKWGTRELVERTPGQGVPSDSEMLWPEPTYVPLQMHSDCCWLLATFTESPTHQMSTEHRGPSKVDPKRVTGPNKTEKFPGHSFYFLPPDPTQCSERHLGRAMCLGSPRSEEIGLHSMSLPWDSVALYGGSHLLVPSLTRSSSTATGCCSRCALCHSPPLGSAKPPHPGPAFPRRQALGPERGLLSTGRDKAEKSVCTHK